MKRAVEGEKAPDFNLVSTSGKDVSLSTYFGKMNVVLFFYPKDNTPGCTKEACEFRDYWSEFKALNTVVYGVSKDSIKSHDKFIEKHNLPYELLSDEEKTVHELYGALNEKNMFGKRVVGTVRSTFIINKEGDLVKEFRNVNPRGHVGEVLEYIKENL